MSGKSLLFLLRRCVAVRPVPTPNGLRAGITAGIRARTGGGVFLLSGETGLYLNRTCRTFWASRAGAARAFCSQAGSPYEYEYPPLPDYELNPEPEKEVHIVQVKGLSWSCTPQDLLDFFSDCSIRGGEEGIHLTQDKMGRATGDAFLEMEHKEDVYKALERHRQYLGARYVKVFEITNSDAEALLKKEAESEAEAVVRLRGLPFTCTEAEVVEFFSGLEIAENGITLVTNSRGRTTGDAFVQFSSQAAAKEALQRDRQAIRHRYIEVFPSQRDEIHSVWRGRKKEADAHREPPQVHGSTDSVEYGRTRTSPHYVHMRGLPYSVSGEDIIEFFSPLVVSKIVLECTRNGKPNGEADVYFHHHQDAQEAMTRDKQNIGNRYIELFLNSVLDDDSR